MEKIIQIFNSSLFQVLIVLIALDTIFGVLRSIKEKKMNSNVGIDGIIRKVLMILSVFFFMWIDSIMNLDMIGFLPEEAKAFIQIEKIGIGSLFNVLFILFEFLSILKNMIKSKLPIPIKLQKWLEKVFSKFTTELNEEGDEK